MHLPEIVTETLGWIAYTFYFYKPFIIAELHLILSAVVPIYAGSYSSLSRPSSAAKKPKKKSKDTTSDDEDDETIQRMEGLAPSDAIVFPIMAGLTLTGLYLLIKWLQSPDLLNKILNWYFATFSVFGVSRMVSDILDLAHSLIFPHDYRDGGVLFHVDAKMRRALPVTIASATEIRTSPLPGIFSRMPLPRRVEKFLWKDRVLPYQKWTFTAIIGPLLDVKVKIGIHGLMGLAVGLSSVIYFNFIAKPWFLTNLMGFAFAYGGLQLMSPTTFATGSMILAALFIYDVYFVFFTPMMVTVAQSLEVPIKLLIPRPADPSKPDEEPGLSMLGLGDVVLPGMLIGLALRFDLFLFYLRKQKKLTAKEARAATAGSALMDDLEEEEADLIAETETDPLTLEDGTLAEKDKDASSTTSPAKDQKAEELITIKAPYTPVHSGFGDRFWTASILPSLFSKKKQHYASRNSFPTPYFHAALFGYIVGLLVTLAVMNVFKHPQPALLYLVPGVVGSIWLTALVRGEMKLAWAFSDAGEEDEEKEEEKSKDEKKITDGTDGAAQKVKEDETSKDAKTAEASQGSRTGGIFSFGRAEQREKASKEFMRKYVNGNSDGSSSSLSDSDKNSSSRNVRPRSDSNEKNDNNRDEKSKSKAKSNRKSSRKAKSEAKSRTVFLLSITAPPPAYPDTDDESERKSKDSRSHEATSLSPNGVDKIDKESELRSWRASNAAKTNKVGGSEDADEELEGHAEKRLRVR